MNNKIFISTPIAGFDSEQQYLEYKKRLVEVGRALQCSFGVENVCGAFWNVKDFSSYDSPEESAKKDLEDIREAGGFILFYPIKVVTSALTELGYAVAMNKRVLIITSNIHILPYMVQGFQVLDGKNIKIIEKDITETDIVNDIIDFFEND